jgi:hypothetical protein
MANIGMASGAVECFLMGYAVRCNFAHEITVAIQTIGIQRLGIAGLYADRVMKTPERKCHGMMVSVASFYEPFIQKIMRHMAVTARSICVVTGAAPAFKLIPHDVAIDTRFRIIGKIGCAPRIIKSISAGSQQHSKQSINQRLHFSGSLSLPIEKTFNNRPIQINMRLENNQN